MSLGARDDGLSSIVARRQRPGGLELGRGVGSREVTWDHNSTLSQGSDGGCAIERCQGLMWLVLSPGQTCTNTWNTSIPPGLLSFQVVFVNKSNRMEDIFLLLS